MTSTNTSNISEYEEIVELIITLQKEEQRKFEELSVQCTNFEHQIRQKELIYKELQKKNNSNISMFSPLNKENEYNESIVWKEENNKQRNELDALYKKTKEYQQKIINLEKIKKYISELYNTKLTISKPGVTSEEELKYKEYSVKLLETQELDRNRIARDLHDSTVQSLTGLVHKTELCTKLLDIDIVRVRLELQSMKEIIKTTIQDMREVIYDLRPMALTNLGLSSAIDSLCEHIKKNHNIEISLQVEGNEIDTPSIVRITLYRIVQEACNNIIKHAFATKVFVNIIYKEDKIQIKVIDNGVGFDINKLQKTQNDVLYGVGLSTMRERANLLKGDIIIDTSPGKGTTIDVCVPILNN